MSEGAGMRPSGCLCWASTQACARAFLSGLMLSCPLKAPASGPCRQALGTQGLPSFSALPDPLLLSGWCQAVAL